MYNTTIHSTDYFETYSLLPLPLPYTLVVNWLQFVSFGIPGFSQFSVHRDIPAPIKGIGGGSRTKNLYFFYLDICYRPIFLLSKMGSYFTQLSLLLILCPFT